MEEQLLDAGAMIGRLQEAASSLLPQVPAASSRFRYSLTVALSSPSAAGSGSSQDASFFFLHKKDFFFFNALSLLDLVSAQRSAPRRLKPASWRRPHHVSQGAVAASSPSGSPKRPAGDADQVP